MCVLKGKQALVTKTSTKLVLTRVHSAQHTAVLPWENTGMTMETSRKAFGKAVLTVTIRKQLVQLSEASLKMRQIGTYSSVKSSVVLAEIATRRFQPCLPQLLRPKDQLL
ncbi:uncharacterized protein LOC144659876 isoform X2 [Oculina patagonica]